MAPYAYDICLDNISEISKDKFKQTIKSKIIEKTHLQLSTELSAKSKTKSITYMTFKRQVYLDNMSPKYAKFIAQARSGTLDIKSQNAKYKDKFCRWCYVEEENLTHIVNCGPETVINVDVPEAISLATNFQVLNEIAIRINHFLDLVN